MPSGPPPAPPLPPMSRSQQDPSRLPLPISAPAPASLPGPVSGPGHAMPVPLPVVPLAGMSDIMAQPQPQPTELQSQLHPPPSHPQLQQHPPQQPLPTQQQIPDMKLTRGHSCVLCQQRKVRCDKNKPCANCVKAQVECRVVPPQPPRRRKKKPHERELVERLRRYEALLAQHGVSIDERRDSGGGSGGHGDGPSQGTRDTQSGTGRGRHEDEVDELQNDMVGLKTSPSPSNPEYTEKWTSPYKEYPRDDSSSDDMEGSTIHHAFDSMFDNQDGFPFVIGGAATKVTDAHPPGMQIFQLWQIYLTNVNPLLKVTHTPTLQAQIIEAGANVAKISRPLEALLFSIYFIAVTSMSEDEVQATFDEDKARLLNRFHRASQQALINAGFMRSPDVMVLQAFFIYLVSLIPIALPTYQQSQICVRQYVDPRSLFCLIGIAVRIAQRLGLHRDGAQFGLPPFEVELRRRLWWQIVAFDKRIAEITGSSITALSSSHGDTRFPLNINDTDLHLHAKDAPTPYAGPTEMVFCLTRVEMCTAGGSESPGGQQAQAQAQRQSSSPASSSTGHPPSSTGHPPPPSTRKFHYSPSPSSPDVVTHMANQTLPLDPDNFCAYMENTYLKSCDPKIPLHFFTLMMTRQALCKMRVVNFLSRTASNASNNNAAAANAGNNPGGTLMGGSLMQNIMGAPAPSDHPQTGGGAAASAPSPNEGPSPERDALFVEAIRMVEYDNVMQSAESLRGFVWYTYMHFPFPAYMFLVMELRSRRSGELVERAWAAICENHERRGLVKNMRSPIHVAFGALFIKAWDAHVEAVTGSDSGATPTGPAPSGSAVPATPKFIQLLRQTIGRQTARPKHQEVVMEEPPASAMPRQTQQHVSSSTASSSTSPPAAAHVQQQQQQQMQADLQNPIGMVYPVGGGVGGNGGNNAGFDGLMGHPMMGMNMNMPEMMDFGAMDWSFFMQGGGEFGGGGGPGGPGGSGAGGFGGGFGSMYGQGG